MNVRISMFAICVETIIYLLLSNLHDSTFKPEDWKARKVKVEMKFLLCFIKECVSAMPCFTQFINLKWYLVSSTTILDLSKILS